jgi:AcrR family transcriptional regulator
MHSMTELCISRREAKRLETAHRLQACAVRLTLDRGFDGWTMDDLAVAADVSRRTVFNYFAGKAEVVLGPEIDVDPALTETFIAGGPTGNLFDDLVLMAHEVTSEKRTGDLDIAALREAIMSDPGLLALVHGRFESAAEHLGDALRQREGDDYPDSRIRLMLRLLITCFDDALDRTALDPDLTFNEHFDATVADARTALTPA